MRDSAHCNHLLALRRGFSSSVKFSEVIRDALNLQCICQIRGKQRSKLNKEIIGKVKTIDTLSSSISVYLHVVVVKGT